MLLTGSLWGVLGRIIGSKASRTPKIGVKVCRTLDGRCNTSHPSFGASGKEHHEEGVLVHHLRLHLRPLVKLNMKGCQELRLASFLDGGFRK